MKSCLLKCCSAYYDSHTDWGGAYLKAALILNTSKNTVHLTTMNEVGSAGGQIFN